MRNQIVGLVAMASALSCEGVPTQDAESQSDNQPGTVSTSGPAPAYSGCGLFGLSVSTATQWRYSINWQGETHGLVIVRVEAVDGTRIELSTTVRLPEENFIHWSTTIDCASHRILTQQHPELALALWPFPGVFEGQQLDWITEDGRFTLSARQPGRQPRSVALTYRTYVGATAGRTRVVRANEQGRMTEFDVTPGTGPVEVRFPDESTLELIGAAHAEALEAILTGEDKEGEANYPGLWPVGDPSWFASVNRPSGTRALSTAAPTQGTEDYSYLCSQQDVTTYDGHWPKVIYVFTTETGSVASSTTMAGDDLTVHHDDRDSEFTFVPDDAQFAHDYEEQGQTVINVEWESAAWFPKHPAPIDLPSSDWYGGPRNYPDPPPASYGANHFVEFYDISYQSPLAGDRIAMRGAAIVDCGHAPLLEIHPASALYWAHQLRNADGSVVPGIANFFFRASSYGWHPHIQSFAGAFEADLDIPDANLMVPGGTPLMGGIAVDYAYSGYDVFDDVHSGDGPYEINHPAAHLTGGDYGQPISNYFDISTSLNGSKVHVYALPKAPFDQPVDPARPALIGFRLVACVPVNDINGKTVNGCLDSRSVDPNIEYIGQVVPARLGETLTGYFYDRHRPNDPLTFEVRAFTNYCDQGHTEATLGTVTTYPPDHTFSFALPPSVTGICPIISPGSPNGELTQGIVLRHFATANTDQPEPFSTELLSYLVPGTCVLTPETIVNNGQCPAGSGFAGQGYFLCGPGPLEPYCQPGASGVPGVPGTPTGVTATGGANQITVAWQPVPMTAAYQVYSVSGTVFTKVASTRYTSIAFTGLGNGVTQSYVVTGLNPDPAGEGPMSAMVTASTLDCSQNCAGCCSNQLCYPSSASTGCISGGQICGAACPAGTDTCSNGICVCHQSNWSVCHPTYNQVDYTRSCGYFTNACGGTVNCGTCQPNYTCTAGAGLSTSCVCTPKTASQACIGYGCNTYAPDGCGGSVWCGSCPAPPPKCTNCVTP